MSALLRGLRIKREELREFALRSGTSPDDKSTASALAAAIDAYVAALLSTPADGKRSTFTTALMRETLHAAPQCGHVLLIKARGGESSQLVNDRPFLFDDKFSTLSSLAVSYLLVAVSDGRVVCAGTKSGTASLHGTIGDDFTVGNTTSH